MKILMVIAQEGFQDKEFGVPYEKFMSKRYDIDIASQNRGKCIGSFGKEVEANLSLDEITADDYDALVLIGGPGSPSLVGIEPLVNALKSANKKGKIIAAICYAPVILATAGMLEGRRATVWNENAKQQIVLEEHGAIFMAVPVFADGRIVTANGPPAAEAFAEQIISLLESRD